MSEEERGREREREREGERERGGERESGRERERGRVSERECERGIICTRLHLNAQRELRASPRNPNVDTVSRSSNSLSLEVWCLSVRAAKLAGATPQPLSSTSTSSSPCSFSLTSG